VLEIIPILLFCFSTSITPGPNNIMLMSSGVNYGIKKSVPHLLGINIGFPLMILAIGLGLGSIFAKFPIVYPVIKVLGVSYLLFFAWKVANATAPKAQERWAKPVTFIQAVLFQWVNPKAWIMATGAIASFTSPQRFQTQMFFILGGYMTVGALCMIFWLTLGASLKTFIHNERRIKYFNRAMAVLLVLSLVPMIFADFNGSVQSVSYGFFPARSNN